MNELFLSVLNMSIAGSIVILAILPVRLLLRRAPKKWSYLIWIAAAFRLCCPVSIRSVISLFRVLPQPAGSGAPSAGETLGRLNYIPPSAAGPSPTAAPVPPLAVTSAAPAPVASAPAATVSPAVSAAPAPAPAGGFSLHTVMSVLAALWIAGMAALLIYAAVDYIRMRKRVSAATKLEGENRVFQSENIASPFILGFLRPQIYIPYGLSESELSCVLAHEKTHVKRGDYIIKAFAFILLTMHWFNPLCWLAFFLMSKDMEMSCDEKVLAGGNVSKEYSMTLLSFASGKRFPAPNPLAFGETAVKERIKNAVKYKKPKLFVSILALVLAAAVVAACVVNPVGEKPDPNSGEEQTETSPAPTSEATAAPTAGPTEKPAPAKGVSFTNSLGETVDKLYVFYAGRLFHGLMNSGTDEWQDEAITAENISAGGSVLNMENERCIFEKDLNYDVGAFVGGRFYVLHDVPLAPAASVELSPGDGAAEFIVTAADGSITEYPAEVYEGDPFTVAARDENLLQLDAVEYYCAIMADSSRTEGYRVDWSDNPVQYDFNDAYMIATMRFEMLVLSPADAARFPALASSLETNNLELRNRIAENIGSADKVVDRAGPASYNLASYVRRADTRILSVLYQIWCGNEEFRHPEPADMSERRYESATFDTATGMLLDPNEAGYDGIDGNIKYEPRENYAWTYDHDGITFFYNALSNVPSAGEFCSIFSNPTLFRDEYLPETENYIVTLSVIPNTSGQDLTVIHADGRDMALEFSVERNEGYSDDGAAWSEIRYGIHANVFDGEDIDYRASANWDDIHLDRVLFVHANGRDYLYILRDEPNSYSVTIFGIHNGRIFKICQSYMLNKLYAGTTDPMDLRGFGLIEVIGSNYGSFRCAVNCYGVPMRTEWYNLYEEHVVLRELEVKLIDKETGAETGETAILKPGQLVIFFRSDGLTIMDILLPDLSAARIETDGRGTWTIGGEGASTYFEDIVVVD